MRRLVFLAAIAVAAAGAVGAFAGGNGAGKATLYDVTATKGAWDCVAGATNTTVPTKGFVVMNINANGELIVTVSIKGGLPDATYDIWLEQNPGTCPPGTSTPSNPAALITNGEGNGNAHFTVTPVAGAENFWLSAWTPAGSLTGTHVLRSTALSP